MKIWPWKTAVPWSRLFQAIAKAGKAVACRVQFAYEIHCFQVRLRCLASLPRTEGAGVAHLEQAAKPTGGQQMCNVLSWLDSNPMLQLTRLHRARPQ